MEILVTRQGSIAEVIERLIAETTRSIDAALYRFNHGRLLEALEAACRRGIQVRLVLDHGKYAEAHLIHHMLSRSQIRLRLLHGRQGPGSKMHHKFAILDGHTILAGSYNWTLESEVQNYDNLMILRGPEPIEPYRHEFEALWAEGIEILNSSRTP